jgi:hypothetical protein
VSVSLTHVEIAAGWGEYMINKPPILNHRLLLLSQIPAARGLALQLAFTVLSSQIITVSDFM